MNCCNSFGRCTQGANCPARETSQVKVRNAKSENFTLGTTEIDQEVESEFSKPLAVVAALVIGLALYALWMVLKLIIN